MIHCQILFQRFFRYHDHIYSKALQEKKKSGRQLRVIHSIPFLKIFRQCLPQCINIFLIFFVTLTVYPSVCSGNYNIIIHIVCNNVLTFWSAERDISFLIFWFQRFTWLIRILSFQMSISFLLPAFLRWIYLRFSAIYAPRRGVHL